MIPVEMDVVSFRFQLAISIEPTFPVYHEWNRYHLGLISLAAARENVYLEVR